MTHAYPLQKAPIKNIDRSRYVISDRKVTLPDVAQRRVTEIYQAHVKAAARHGQKVFDGDLLRVKAIRGSDVLCERSKFSHLLAWQEEPELLSSVLNRETKGADRDYQGRYLSLAMSAAVQTIFPSDGEEGKLIFGKRTPGVLQFPNAWELAVSGTVKPDDIDVESQQISDCLLFQKLAEETGIEPHDVDLHFQMAVLEAGDVLESSHRVLLRIDEHEVEQRIANASRQQYTEWKFLKPADAKKFTAEQGDQGIVDTTRYMVNHLI